jgi:hypothetical protein
MRPRGTAGMLAVVAWAHWSCCDAQQASDAVAALPSNQVRLGLGSTPESSVMVTWLTARADMSSASEYLVYYATSPDGLADPGVVLTVAASSQEYNITDSVYTASVGAFLPTTVYFSPYIHHAEVKGLTPLTRYFYQVTVEGGSRSAVFNFTTVSRRGKLPGPGPSVTVICGDIGQTQNSRNTIAAIMEHRGYTDLADAVQFGIIVGDMSCVVLDSACTRPAPRGRILPPSYASLRSSLAVQPSFLLSASSPPPPPPPPPTATPI